MQNAKDENGRKAARKQLGMDVLKHVKDIQERYIITGETAESACLFLPSEAVYAELHANMLDVVEKSYDARVWIVSPTTMMATLNTVRAILKDARMREQTALIQKEIGMLVGDVTRLDKRVDNLGKHFDLAQKDVQEIKTSTGKTAIADDVSKILMLKVTRLKMSFPARRICFQPHRTQIVTKAVWCYKAVLA